MTNSSSPWNHEAEAAALGVILRSEADLDELKDELHVDDFHDPRHRAIYSAIAELSQRGVAVDLVTVYDALRSGAGTRQVDASYLAGLCEAAPVPSHFPHYLNILRRDASRRKCLEAIRRFETSLSQPNQEGEVHATDQLIQELSRIHQAEHPAPSKWQTAAEVVNAQQISVGWLWERFLARGHLTLLSAKPKTGKTTLVFHFLSALLNNQPFLDQATVQSGKVLLCTEEGPALLKRRLERLGLSRDDLLILPRSALTGWADTLQQLHQAARQGVCLAIIDTLAAFWNVEDENDAPKAGAALLPLQMLVQRHGIAVLLVHHLRKTPGEEGTAHRGSGAIVATVDVALEMSRDPQRPNRRKLTALSRFDETPQQLIIEREGGVYQSKGSPEAVSRAEVKEQVMNALPGPDEEPIDRDALLEQLDPKPSVSLLKEVLRVLAENERLAERLGAGKKGDPYRYRRADNSHSATPKDSYVAESNTGPQLGARASTVGRLGAGAKQAVELIQQVFPGTAVCDGAP